MAFFNFNGKMLEENTPVIGPDNRGLRYGDGLFETLRYKNKEVILLDEHLSRLWNGMRLLQFEIPKLFTPDKIEEEINLLLSKNKNSNARIRLSIYRGNGGLYDAQSHIPQFIIQSWELKNIPENLNENGLQLCLYKDAVKTIDRFSNCKHNNFLPYFMGALYAKSNRCNDAILLNQLGNICDTTIANIFIISKGNICTPSLSEGCVAGIMRKEIINTLKKNELTILEQPVTVNDIVNADEVFVSNSIFPLRWVSSIGESTYTNQRIVEIYSTLQRTNPQVFC